MREELCVVSDNSGKTKIVVKRPRAAARCFARDEIFIYVYFISCGTALRVQWALFPVKTAGFLQQCLALRGLSSNRDEPFDAQGLACRDDGFRELVVLGTVTLLPTDHTPVLVLREPTRSLLLSSLEDLRSALLSTCDLAHSLGLLFHTLHGFFHALHSLFRLHTFHRLRHDIESLFLYR